MEIGISRVRIRIKQIVDRTGIATSHPHSVTWRSLVQLACQGHGILGSWVMGLLRSRDPPGFQHTLAVSLAFWLSVIQLVNFSCVSPMVSRVCVWVLCGLCLDSHQSFLVLGDGGR